MENQQGEFVFIRSLKHEGQGAWDGSNNVLWWGPDRAGYSEDIRLAGVYPVGAAKEIVADATPGKNVLIPVETAKRAAVGPFVSKMALDAATIQNPDGTNAG